MTERPIKGLEEKLDAVLSQLRKTKDPILRRNLLAEMRILMAELDRLVLDSMRPYSARPD